VVLGISSTCLKASLTLSDLVGGGGAVDLNGDGSLRGVGSLMGVFALEALSAMGIKESPEHDKD